jgi:hypothetical protein
MKELQITRKTETRQKKRKTQNQVLVCAAQKYLSFLLAILLHSTPRSQCCLLFIATLFLLCALPPSVGFLLVVVVVVQTRFLPCTMLSSSMSFASSSSVFAPPTPLSSSTASSTSLASSSSSLSSSSFTTASSAFATPPPSSARSALTQSMGGRSHLSHRLSQEFRALPRPPATRREAFHAFACAIDPENSCKNRYPDVLPYDQYRVRLRRATTMATPSQQSSTSATTTTTTTAAVDDGDAPSSLASSASSLALSTSAPASSGFASACLRSSTSMLPSASTSTTPPPPSLDDTPMLVCDVGAAAPSRSEGQSDYINASFIPGIHPMSYISCQAPLPHTFGDFWCMIWVCVFSLVYMHIVVILHLL